LKLQTAQIVGSPSKKGKVGQPTSGLEYGYKGPTYRPAMVDGGADRVVRND
jgi:hypothetical protein